jgi:hypothetical protein
MPHNQVMSEKTHTHVVGLKTHVVGLKTHVSGLKVEDIREHFALVDGTVIWKKTTHPSRGEQVGTPAGYQAFSRVGGRKYWGNIFVNLNGVRLTAQEIAWAIHYGEFAKEHLRIIHLDGDKTNQDPSNLHIQPKPGVPDPDLES